MFIQATPGAASARAIEYDADTALTRLRKHDGPGSYVIGQLGQSLDGRIATPTGASKYINGQDALRHLHAIRAEVDAVVIGVGTAVADDPALTTRHVEGPDPVRVIIDPHGRLPHDIAMLHDGKTEVLALTCCGVESAPGTTSIEMECDGCEKIEPAAILRALAKRGLHKILIEGGAKTLAGFINAEALDELHLMLAPIILGSGKTGLDLAPIETLDQAYRPMVRTMRFRDGDMLCMCDLQEQRAYVA
ncbi:MAG: RibD family protein [Pseudomonadota bacterium]